MARLYPKFPTTRRGVSTLILLSLTLAAAPLSAKPRLHTVVYDHSTGSLTCTEVESGTSIVPSAGVCLLSIRDGDIVALRVSNSIGGLFTLNVTRTNKALAAVPKSAATKMGIPAEAAIPVAGAPPAKTLATTVVEAFNTYSEAFANLQKGINSGGFSAYRTLRDALEDARRDLLRLLGGTTPSDPASIAKAVKAASASPAATDETAVAARIREIEGFRVSTSEALVDLAPHDEELVDRAFTLVCEVKTTDERFKGAQRAFVVEVAEKGAWSVSTTGGFAFSGLTDKDFTKRTVVDSPASGTTPEKTHNELVEQPRDSVLPEAAIFINVFPFASKLDWLAASLGAGVTTGASGRLYGGISLRLGRVAHLTAGVAGGKVKRLSSGVDPKNLGTVDPHATRVDKYETSWFGAVSFRIGS